MGKIIYKGQEFQGRIERVETEYDNEFTFEMGLYGIPNVLCDEFGTLETYNGGDIS